MGTPLRRAAVIVAAALAVLVAVGAWRQAPTRPARAQLTPVAERAAAAAGSTLRAALIVRLPAGQHAQSNAPREKSLIPTRLTFTAVDGVAPTEVVFPPTEDVTIPGYDQPLAVFQREFIVGVQFSIAAGHPPGTISIPGHFRYQACNDVMCFAPVTLETSWTVRVVPAGTPAGAAEQPTVFAGIAFGHGEKPTVTAAAATPAPIAAGPVSDERVLSALDDFEILGTTGYSNVGDFLTFIHDAERGVKPSGMFEGRGPLAILLLVFVGGLALNLTPCVLPMVPINLAIIGAGARGADKRRGAVLGATYGAAMALIYGVLGVVVIRTAGTFGTINASPWFNLGIAVLFVVLGLAMFDVLMIDFSRFSSGIRFGGTRGSLWLAFTMGAVAALLAGACVAPVVIQVIVFASNLYAKGTQLALGLPFVLGLGMALPWPIAGAGLSLLPKPGAWMERVKYVFGVFILATAAYYGYEAYSIFSSRWVDPASVQASTDEQLKAGWQPSLAAGLAEGARDHKLVFVDVWATWCKNCLVMNKTTLADSQVQDALRNFVRVKYQAEDLDRSPIREVMQRFGAVGLPAYVILKPKNGT